MLRIDNSDAITIFTTTQLSKSLLLMSALHQIILILFSRYMRNTTWNNKSVNHHVVTVNLGSTYLSNKHNYMVKDMHS